MKEKLTVLALAEQELGGILPCSLFFWNLIRCWIKGTKNIFPSHFSSFLIFSAHFGNTELKREFQQDVYYLTSLFIVAALLLPLWGTLLLGYERIGILRYPTPRRKLIYFPLNFSIHKFAKGFWKTTYDHWVLYLQPKNTWVIRYLVAAELMYGITSLTLIHKGILHT